jgi:hypothetical protein
MEKTFMLKQLNTLPNISESITYGLEDHAVALSQ